MLNCSGIHPPSVVLPSRFCDGKHFICDICRPKERWTEPQSEQRSIPRLILAEHGPGAPQSPHTMELIPVPRAPGVCLPLPEPPPLFVEVSFDLLPSIFSRFALRHDTPNPLLQIFNSNVEKKSFVNCLPTTNSNWRCDASFGQGLWRDWN